MAADAYGARPESLKVLQTSFTEDSVSHVQNFQGDFTPGCLKFG